MREQSKGLKSVMRAGAAATLASGMIAAVAPGCLNRPIEPVEPRTTSTIVERLAQSKVDKIDMLLVIDNSRSMADKQSILKDAVPTMVEQLVNPKCVKLEEDGAVIEQPVQPDTPLLECDEGEGFGREFDPITDIHIGVLSSSVGGHGSDACAATTNSSENDHAWLINRIDTTGMSPPAATYNNGSEDLKFLVWDPDAANPSHQPQGLTDLTTLSTELGKMVAGAGEVGCGFEAQLEAWYRFLIDPNPYESITLEGEAAVVQGTDSVLLAQRENFLRPDSLLAVIMLSDENDCSIRDGSQFYFAAQIYQPGSTSAYHLPKPRHQCAINPEDECCKSCGQSVPDSCNPDQDDCSGALDAIDDHVNLRCYDQKRRFGIDFLQPIERYTNGLTQSKIDDRDGNLQPNPIFSDLRPEDDNSNIRDASLVFVAGVVGVPWQDIARKNEQGDPDLLNGLDTAQDPPAPVGGFQSGDELAVNGTWDVILGDPSCYATNPDCLPTDPLMRESVDPRDGANPVTGDPIVTGTSPLGNGINGHEYDISTRDDLQFACIFELSDPKDCATVPAGQNCDCDSKAIAAESPLCYDGTGYDQIQRRAKAYPGIRELQVLRNVGEQGIVGSICPAQTSNEAGKDFGYNPAVQAIVDRLKLALEGQCLQRSLTPNAEKQVACLVLEGRVADDCNCSSPGRQEVGPESQAAKDAALEQSPGLNCFCEITQLSGASPGEPLYECQNQNTENVVIDGETVDGWCYVDAATVPPLGNPDIVDNCPINEKRIIKFVGEGKGAIGSTLFITCTGE